MIALQTWYHEQFVCYEDFKQQIFTCSPQEMRDEDRTRRYQNQKISKPYFEQRLSDLGFRPRLNLQTRFEDLITAVGYGLRRKRAGSMDLSIKGWRSRVYMPAKFLNAYLYRREKGIPNPTEAGGIEDRALKDSQSPNQPGQLALPDSAGTDGTEEVTEEDKKRQRERLSRVKPEEMLRKSVLQEYMQFEEGRRSGDFEGIWDWDQEDGGLSGMARKSIAPGHLDQRMSSSASGDDNVTISKTLQDLAERPGPAADQGSHHNQPPTTPSVMASSELRTATRGSGVGSDGISSQSNIRGTTHKSPIVRWNTSGEDGFLSGSTLELPNPPPTAGSLGFSEDSRQELASRQFSRQSAGSQRGNLVSRDSKATGSRSAKRVSIDPESESLGPKKDPRHSDVPLDELPVSASTTLPVAPSSSASISSGKPKLPKVEAKVEAKKKHLYGPKALVEPEIEEAPRDSFWGDFEDSFPGVLGEKSSTLDGDGSALIYMLQSARKQQNKLTSPRSQAKEKEKSQPVVVEETPKVKTPSPKEKRDAMEAEKKVNRKAAYTSNPPKLGQVAGGSPTNSKKLRKQQTSPRLGIKEESSPSPTGSPVSSDARPGSPKVVDRVDSNDLMLDSQALNSVIKDLGLGIDSQPPVLEPPMLETNPRKSGRNTRQLPPIPMPLSSPAVLHKEGHHRNENPPSEFGASEFGDSAEAQLDVACDAVENIIMTSTHSQEALLAMEEAARELEGEKKSSSSQSGIAPLDSDENPLAVPQTPGFGLPSSAAPDSGPESIPEAVTSAAADSDALEGGHNQMAATVTTMNTTNNTLSGSGNSGTDADNQDPASPPKTGRSEFTKQAELTMEDEGGPARSMPQTPGAVTPARSSVKSARVEPVTPGEGEPKPQSSMFEQDSNGKPKKRHTTPSIGSQHDSGVDIIGEDGRPRSLRSNKSSPELGTSATGDDSQFLIGKNQSDLVGAGIISQPTGGDKSMAPPLIMIQKTAQKNEEIAGALHRAHHRAFRKTHKQNSTMDALAALDRTRFMNWQPSDQVLKGIGSGSTTRECKKKPNRKLKKGKREFHVDEITPKGIQTGDEQCAEACQKLGWEKRVDGGGEVSYRYATGNSPDFLDIPKGPGRHANFSNDNSPTGSRERNAKEAGQSVDKEKTKAKNTSSLSVLGPDPRLDLVHPAQKVTPKEMERLRKQAIEEKKEGPISLGPTRMSDYNNTKQSEAQDKKLLPHNSQQTGNTVVAAKSTKAKEESHCSPAASKSMEDMRQNNGRFGTVGRAPAKLHGHMKDIVSPRSPNLLTLLESDTSTSTATRPGTGGGSKQTTGTNFNGQPTSPGGSPKNGGDGSGNDAEKSPRDKKDKEMDPTAMEAYYSRSKNNPFVNNPFMMGLDVMWRKMKNSLIPERSFKDLACQQAYQLGINGMLNKEKYEELSGFYDNNLGEKYKISREDPAKKKLENSKSGKYSVIRKNTEGTGLEYHIYERSVPTSTLAQRIHPWNNPGVPQYGLPQKYTLMAKMKRKRSLKLPALDSDGQPKTQPDDSAKDGEDGEEESAEKKRESMRLKVLNEMQKGGLGKEEMKSGRRSSRSARAQEEADAKGGNGTDSRRSQRRASLGAKLDITHGSSGTDAENDIEGFLSSNGRRRSISASESREMMSSLLAASRKEEAKQIGRDDSWKPILDSFWELAEIIFERRYGENADTSDEENELTIPLPKNKSKKNVPSSIHLESKASIFKKNGGRAPSKHGRDHIIRRIQESLLENAGILELYRRKRKQFFSRLFQCLASHGDGFLHHDDLGWLCSWEPRPWLLATPNIEYAKELKSVLKKKYNNNDLFVWKVLDADHSQKVGWGELYTAVKACHWPDTDQKLPGAWRAIDTNSNGYISLPDYEPDTCKLLVRFFNWVRERFGDFETYLSYIDEDYNPRPGQGKRKEAFSGVRYPMFRAKMRYYGWAESTLQLFKLLDVEDRNKVRAACIKHFESYDYLFYEIPHPNDIGGKGARSIEQQSRRKKLEVELKKAKVELQKEREKQTVEIRTSVREQRRKSRIAGQEDNFFGGFGIGSVPMDLTGGSTNLNVSPVMGIDAGRKSAVMTAQLSARKSVMGNEVSPRPSFREGAGERIPGLSVPLGPGSGQKSLGLPSGTQTAPVQQTVTDTNAVTSITLTLSTNITGPPQSSQGTGSPRLNATGPPSSRGEWRPHLDLKKGGLAQLGVAIPAARKLSGAGWKNSKEARDQDAQADGSRVISQADQDVQNLEAYHLALELEKKKLAEEEMKKSGQSSVVQFQHNTINISKSADDASPDDSHDKKLMSELRRAEDEHAGGALIKPSPTSGTSPKEGEAEASVDISEIKRAKKQSQPKGEPKPGSDEHTDQMLKSYLTNP